MDAEKSSPHQLRRSVDALLGRGRVPPVDAVSAAEQFHRFFDDKVASGNLPQLALHRRCSSRRRTPVVASFQYFKPVIVDNVVAAVRVLPDKSHTSDPLLINPHKAVVDIIAPFLTNLFNSSLANALVPEALKAAFISPRLKKPGLDPADVRS